VITLPPPFPPFSFSVTSDREIDHTNLYLYSYIKPLDSLTFTVGSSYDDFDADDENIKDQDQLNPKFGITWNPFRDTTLRTAVFRVLKRTLISDQTLEPTQVAGFNQFFDDSIGTESWHYGIAIDQKFSRDIYGGAEFSYRDLSVPYNDVLANELKDAAWDEYFGRSYLYWTPHEWLALSTEYQYERFDRDREFAIGIHRITTHSVPLGMNFFHPSGLSASLKATFFDQDGDFERLNASGNFENGEDQFWVVDAAISYRLPKRFGFITVGARNLFDNSFKYYDTDRTSEFSENVDAPLVRSPIQPDRLVFLKFTLAL
jgi:hypothetical protein